MQAMQRNKPPQRISITIWAQKKNICTIITPDDADAIFINI